CSKTTSAFSLVMLASRVSHWTSSNGATPGRVKYRFQGSPLRLRLGAVLGAAAVTLGRSVEVFWVDRAIVNLRRVGWRAAHIVCRRMKPVKQFTTACRVSQYLRPQHMLIPA